MSRGVSRFMLVAAIALSCWLVLAPASATAESYQPRGDAAREIQGFVSKATPPVQRKTTSARSGQGSGQSETERVLHYVYLILGLFVAGLIALACAFAALAGKGDR